MFDHLVFLPMNNVHNHGTKYEFHVEEVQKNILSKPVDLTKRIRLIKNWLRFFFKPRAIIQLRFTDFEVDLNYSFSKEIILDMLF